MNSDLSARLGALLLSVLLLCGLFSGCNAQPAASSGEAYPVSPPAAALSEAPAKVTEPPGFPSSETPPGRSIFPCNRSGRTGTAPCGAFARGTARQAHDSDGTHPRGARQGQKRGRRGGDRLFQPQRGLCDGQIFGRRLAGQDSDHRPGQDHLYL